MKMHINTNKITLTERQEQYIKDKISALSKYYDQLLDPTVLARLNIEENTTLGQREKLILKILISGHKVSFRGELNAATVEEGIDLLMDKLYKQIDRYKNKHVISQVRNDDLIENLEGEELVEPDVRISKRKLFSDLIPMSESEALDTMLMLGHTFFIFVNESTDRYNLIYKRKDDDTYGLIELEHQGGVIS